MTTYQRGYSKGVKYGKLSATIRTKTVLPEYIAPEGSARFVEVTQSPEFWSVNEEEQLSTPWDQSDLSNSQLEALDEARNKLVEHILANLPDILTARQLQIFLSFLDGSKTQDQIAKEIGISARGAISYSLHGQPKNGIRQGGSIPALQKWAAEDPTCIALIVRIQQIISYDPDEDRPIRSEKNE